MAFGRIAELRIREAISEGKFDRLPNSGQRLDLDWYFAMPEQLRLGYGLLKSNECAPIEVELLREIANYNRRFNRDDLSIGRQGNLWTGRLGLWS